jgi:hypothetical protein
MTRRSPFTLLADLVEQLDAAGAEGMTADQLAAALNVKPATVRTGIFRLRGAPGWPLVDLVSYGRALPARYVLRRPGELRPPA